MAIQCTYHFLGYGTWSLGGQWTAAFLRCLYKTADRLVISTQRDMSEEYSMLSKHVKVKENLDLSFLKKLRNVHGVKTPARVCFFSEVLKTRLCVAKRNTVRVKLCGQRQLDRHFPTDCPSRNVWRSGP